VLIKVDAKDPTTLDVLHEYTQKLEQQAWLVSPETHGP
jgi:starvation-inducible DNA-binding protein